MPIPRLYQTTPRALRFGIVLLSVTGCATAGSTFRSGVGDELLEDAPYYAIALSYPVGTVAHVPIAYQPGASQAEMFDPAARPDSPITALLAEMNAYLDSLDVTTPLPRLRGTAPDVKFGCDQDHLEECIRESDASTGYGAPWMRLAVASPSREWIASAQSAVAGAQADAVLVITLEVGRYWPHQSNLRGDKEVRLGTGHTVRVPWLTALDQPVQVLQLTGALVGPDGRAQRIGAEGLVARRTSVLLVSFGVHELLSDADVDSVRTAVRADLPGEPLVWRAALHELIAELTASDELKLR